MQNNNIIYEITKVIGDPNSIKSDLNESFNVFVKNLQERYMQKFNSAFLSVKNNSKSELSKEFNLIESIKPFISENQHQKIDTALNLITNINAAMKMHSDFKTISFEIPKTNADQNDRNFNKQSPLDPSEDSSVHEDGVYDYAQKLKRSSPSSNSNSLLPFILLALVAFGKPKQ